jgi:hypothetical protein
MNTAPLMTPAGRSRLPRVWPDLSMQPFFAIFRKRSQLPQTKPTQKKSAKTMLEDEQRNHWK